MNAKEEEELIKCLVQLQGKKDTSASTTIAIVGSSESVAAAKSAASLSRPSVICRICLNNGDLERLLTPCDCKGTQGFVHRECLEYWLTSSGMSHCELCLYRFATVDYLRYGMWESMRIWFSHPSNRALLQSDLLLCSLLTIITLGLMVISTLGMYYLASAASHDSSTHDETTRYWTETSIGVFLGIVVFSFVLNTAAVVKANIIPWFRWWRRCKEIQLLVGENRNNNSSSGKSDRQLQHV